MKRRTFLKKSAITLVTGALSGMLTGCSRRARRPNFVIVLADDVSWSSFGCMNAKGALPTPHIDRLAEQGLLFQNFFCASAQCVPVRHELYTGLLPSRSGIYDNSDQPKKEFKNVVDYLGAAGYEVGLTGKLGFKAKTLIPKIQGFTTGANHPDPDWSLEGVKNFIQSSREKNNPFCVFVCSVHAHHPWTAQVPHQLLPDKITLPEHMVDGPVTRQCMVEHGAEVVELDEQVGAVDRLLGEMNVRDDTVMIFLSEQGMAMPNGKWSVYDYGCRALKIVRWPGVIKANTKTDAVAMYCDILPTLIELAGGDAPVIDGRSLVDVWMDKESRHREFALLYGQKYLWQRAIRTASHKLIWSPRDSTYHQPRLMESQYEKRFYEAWVEWKEKAETEKDAKIKVDHVIDHPEFELYDLTNDPFETTNLADLTKHKELIQNLFSRLKTTLKEMGENV